MIEKIKEAIDKIDNISKKKEIKIISHFDTDGICSAAILTRAFQRLGKKFSLEIIKNLEEEYIKALPEDKILIFSDLASNSLNYLKEKNTEIFILDHHEVIQEIPKNVFMINPILEKKEPLSASAICYLFAKAISNQNKDLATLGLIGLTGDSMEKNLSKTGAEIIKDSEAVVKKGILIYPSTRPIDKALEYSSSPFIPGVTGSYKGVLELIREAGIQKIDGRYKSICELNETEMSKLVTAIMIKCAAQKNISEIIGNIYLVKFFNGLEDVRELSALINACSRMDKPNISLGFCLGNKKMKIEAEKIYIEYKQHLVSALKYISETNKISGEKYTIINAKDNIKDTIIGTVASIISNSSYYKEGTIIIALAYNKDKIKASARIVGKEGKNVREVLSKVVVPLGGEVGGHPNAAGCLISKEHEDVFIEKLRRTLETEVVKV